MPGILSCAQILWSNLWISRSWLAQSQVLHGFGGVARFLISQLRAKLEPDQRLCPQVVPCRQPNSIHRLCATGWQTAATCVP